MTEAFKAFVSLNIKMRAATLYGMSCATNGCLTQQEVDQAGYLLKRMSIPLSKQITSVREGQLIAIIEAHCMWCVFILWACELQQVYRNKALLNPYMTLCGFYESITIVNKLNNRTELGEVT